MKDKRSLLQRFNEFDGQNPTIWKLFKDYVFEKIRAGFKKLGAKKIIEDLRWNPSVKTSGREFKLSNDLTAYYARKFQREFPQHKDIFDTKRVKADDNGEPPEPSGPQQLDLL